MASELGLPPPAKRPPATPTTTASISDDLLCEIFLLLPSLPSLVRAALACRTFLNAVRSSPAFRRRFWALHPPQLLGFFIEPCRAAVPPFVPLRSRSDPDLAAAVRGSDFFLTRLPEDSGDSTLGWKLQGLHGGYVDLADDATDQIAAYNPVTQALHLLPRPPKEILFSNSLEFHIVFSEEDQRVFRMVCVQHQDGQVPACVAVFSTATREWQFLPWVETPPPPPHDFIKFCPGTQLNGFVYWKHISRPYVLVLNTVTVQFSRVDLPPFLGHICPTRFRLGQTKDGMLCMVGIDDSDADTGMLHVWFRRADDDGVEKWVLGDTYILTTFVVATKADGDPTVHIEAVIDGFVYLSTKYDEHTNNHTESLLSLCLETAKLNKLFDDTYVSPAHPYIIAWPPSLVCSKEDSQTMVTGESVADAAPVGTKETSSVNASASQSYKFDK